MVGRLARDGRADTTAVLSLNEAHSIFAAGFGSGRPCITMTASLPAFAIHLPDDIAGRVVERHFEPQQDLFLERDETDELLGILAGRVKLWRMLEDGRTWTMLTLGPGELLGSVAVVQARPQLISATALDHVVVTAWSGDLVRAALKRNPEFADELLRLVAKRAGQLVERIGDVAGVSVEKRLARILLRLVGGCDRPDDEFSAAVAVRQQELADMALTTVPTVSRTLTAWSRDGVVHAERGRLTVPDLSRLASVAGVHLD